MTDGASAEIAVVGNEGLVVQSAGRALRLGASAMKEVFKRAGPVLHFMLRHTQALIIQMLQTAVCNRHHSLDQQSSAT